MCPLPNEVTENNEKYAARAIVANFVTEFI